MTTLTFDQGTIVVNGAAHSATAPPGFLWDRRVQVWRAEGYRYRDTVLWMRSRGIPFIDQARQYRPQSLHPQPRTSIELFDYQKQSLLAWQKADRRGIVALPTGAGKTVVGAEAIALAERPAIVVVPTLDLLNQWHSRLNDYFGIEIGLIGQGISDIREVTVITYQSAYRRMAEIGHRFGLLILDEVHHLAAPEWMEIARLSIAPFRLGLTATYDPHSARELNELVGPLVFWKPIRELSGTRLAPYQVVRLSVDLRPDERQTYMREREIYLRYWRSRSTLAGTGARLEILLQEQARDQVARRAMLAWQEMRRIVAGSEAKLDLLEELFRRHATNRAIVFTANNEMAYRISREFLIPAITHRTPTRERKTILRKFEKGEYKAVASSRVLNEGVDVPEATVAIVLGGSGSTREHTQRLGRVLRRRENKLAVLYEITARGTLESAISHRRRQTEAYAGRAGRLTKLERQC